MNRIDSMKSRLQDVPQFVREQKDVWTDKQQRYDNGVIRSRFHISDDVERFVDWRLNGQPWNRPVKMTRQQPKRVAGSGWRVRDGINPKYGKAVLWTVAVIMLVIVLTDVTRLAVVDGELKEINTMIVSTREKSAKIDSELASQLGTSYISRATQLNSVSATSNTYIIHVPDDATLPLEIAESEISRENLAVIYGD